MRKVWCGKVNKNKFYKAKEKWYAGSIRSVITKHKKNYQCSVKFVKDGECETLDLGLSTYEKEWFIAKEKIEEIVEEEDSEEEVVEPIVESAKEVVEPIVEPIVESAKEVVEKIPDTPDLNEKQLKDRMESLERVVNQLMQDNNGVYIHGSCSNHAANAFHNMTPTLKSQYLVGPKLCDPKFPKAKAMCAYNKNMQYQCMSKVLCERVFFPPKTLKADKEKGINGVAKDVYISDEGRYIHRPLFFEKFVRDRADNVKTIISHYRLCPACVNSYCDREDFINTWNSTKSICLICRKKGRSSGTDLTCRFCIKKDAGGHEFALRIMCNELKISIPRYNIFVNDNITVYVDDDKFVIDLRINGLFEGTCFTIIIEKDEKQHVGKNTVNEKKKLMYETFAVMNHSTNAKQKILVIRYNPDAEYIENGANHSDYNGIERLLILRRWIIWWLMNIHTVRDMIILYLWYDDTKVTGFEGFKGFSKVYHAPKPVKMGWEYCLDIYEYEYMVSINSPVIVNERPAVGTDAKHPFQWEKIYEDENDKYPSDLKALLMIISLCVIRRL